MKNNKMVVKTASKDVSQTRRQLRRKCSFLRFLVIVLSFISLLSRIIYCTFATWLTITTFDCHPCPNATLLSSNTSTPLFISHHSSALFKSVRGLNIESKEVDNKLRAKRSNVLPTIDRNSSQPMVVNGNESLWINETFDQFLNDTIEISLDLNVEMDDKSDNQTKADNQTLPNATNSSSNQFMEIEIVLENSKNKSLNSNANYNLTEDLLTIVINGTQFGNKSRSDDFLELKSDSDHHLNDSNRSKRHSVAMIANLTQGLYSDDNGTHFDRFDPNSDHISHETNGSNANTSDGNDSSDWHQWSNELSADDSPASANTMTIRLDDRRPNSSNAVSKDKEPKFPINQNDLTDDQLVNDTGYIMTSTGQSKGPIDVCSDDCSEFLSIELNDPSMRKWATIVITGVLYVYAFVMFGIFMGACLALVDLLVIATFIEGAKLFAGFILIIIDSFNGKGVEFNLIDIRFNVNNGGNGWSADFSYSEYLLDIIIFFLSAYLCIRVFRCFEKKPQKVSSIEELVDTRGTYRPNPSRNDLEPIFEN